MSGQAAEKKENKIVLWILFGIFFLLTAGIFYFIAGFRPKAIFPALEKEKTQILFLGDSNIDYSFGGMEIPEMLMQKTNVMAYNCAIGGTCAANSAEPYNRKNYYGMFSLYNLSKMIETGDFSVMTRNRDFIDSSSSDIKGKVLILEHLDYSAMDYVVLHYGMNDYFAGFPIGDGMEKYDERTYKGALRCGIERIHKMCPDATVILSSITYCRYQKVENEELVGETISGLSHDFGHGTIENYRTAMEEVSGEYPYAVFLDNLNGMGIDDENYITEGYFEDHMHFGEKSREIYTEGFLELLTKLENR